MHSGGRCPYLWDLCCLQAECQDGVKFLVSGKCPSSLASRPTELSARTSLCKCKKQRKPGLCPPLSTLHGICFYCHQTSALKVLPPESTGLPHKCTSPSAWEFTSRPGLTGACVSNLPERSSSIISITAPHTLKNEVPVISKLF